MENPSTSAHNQAADFFGTTEAIKFGIVRSEGPTRFRDALPFPYLTQSGSTSFIEVSSGELKVHGHPGNWASLAQLFDSENSDTIFYLKPQRMAPALHPYGEAPILSQNGDNLPLVLTYLQNRRPDVFDEIVFHLNFIVGNVNGITVGPRGGACEVLIWPTENRARDELSFDLENSGTGVAQCLTILAAASSEIPSSILIDEINSFLHPSAVKRLIYVLREYYNYHQYIISTHSADVISHSGASSAYYIEKF